MHNAILLCAAMLAADDPAPVQVKVLYGTADENQQRADIDLWISRAVARTGCPLALPYTGWIALTDKSQRLHSANGLYIDGTATVRNGKYDVEIEGCNGFSLDQNVTLKPGERRVVNLSGIPGPDNFFVALKAPISEQAKERADAMKTDVETFHLDLQYNGEQGKPFYRLVVSVPAVVRRRSSPFERIVQIKEDEASRIIGHLARDGFLDSAVDPRNQAKLPPPSMPGYTMKVVTGDMPLYEDLGWGLPMIERLDALREVLPDQGNKDMELFLGRLSGLRKQWEADKAGRKSLKG